MPKHIHIHLGAGVRILGSVVRRALTGDDFDESKHKRDSDGKFSTTGGGAAHPEDGKVKPSFNQHMSGKLKEKGFEPTKLKAPNGATIWHHPSLQVKVHAAAHGPGKASSGSSNWESNKEGKSAVQGSSMKDLETLLTDTKKPKAPESLSYEQAKAAHEASKAAAPPPPAAKPDTSTAPGSYPGKGTPTPVANLAKHHQLSLNKKHVLEGTTWREYTTQTGGTVYVATNSGDKHKWVSGAPGKQTKSGQGLDGLHELLQGKVPATATNHFGKSPADVFAEKSGTAAASPPPPAPANGPSSHTEKYANNLKSMGHTYQQAAKGQKVPTESQHNAISSYTGSGYATINSALRQSRGATVSPSAQKITDYLNEASFPEELVLRRGVKGGFAEAILSSIEEGTVFVDHGFVSMSTGAGFQGQMSMHVTVPKGSKAAGVSHIGGNTGESEILAQRGSRFRVDKIQGNDVHVTLLPPKEKK